METAPPIGWFPNKGTLTGVLLEFPLLRSPRGEIFGGGTVPKHNPDRVVFHLDADTDTVTFMGVMSHAGNEPRGFGKRDFVVSGFYYYKTRLVCPL